MARIRLAVVVSHPVPYYVTLYKALVEHGGVEVRAFFSSRIGVAATPDPDMGVNISWATDVLGGYDSTFLPNAEKIIGTSFREIDNPGTGAALSAFAPDVVLIHGYTQMTMLRALFWCFVNRVPALMISDSSLHLATTPLQRLAKRIVLPHLLGRFSAFLTVGDANETYLKAFGVPPAALFRTPHILDRGFWERRERREETRASVRRSLGLEPNDLAVLYVGKLIARKRPRDLLQALARLRAMAPGGRPIIVLFAGNGVQRAELEQEAAAANLPARFLGFVNIDTLPDYFCAADVLAHPAEVETFGVIVLEAAVIGLPLVLSDRVGAIGPTSIARPGENAVLHPCGDVQALADALARLATEPETLDRMAAASLRISRELDWRMSVSGAVRAIEYAIGQRRQLAMAA